MRMLASHSIVALLCFALVAMGQDPNEQYLAETQDVQREKPEEDPVAKELVRELEIAMRVAIQQLMNKDAAISSALDEAVQTLWFFMPNVPQELQHVAPPQTGSDSSRGYVLRLYPVDGVSPLAYWGVPGDLDDGSADGQLVYWDNTESNWVHTTTGPSADGVIAWWDTTATNWDFSTVPGTNQIPLWCGTNIVWTNQYELTDGDYRGEILFWSAAATNWVVSAAPGAHDAAILWWKDSTTNMVWTEQPESATNTFLRWDGTNVVWDEVPTNAPISDGTYQGQLLYWDTGETNWQATPTAPNEDGAVAWWDDVATNWVFTGAPNTNDVLQWDGDSVVWGPSQSTNHSELSELGWTDSGHTGTADRIAYFDETGAAAFLETNALIQQVDQAEVVAAESNMVFSLTFSGHTYTSDVSAFFDNTDDQAVEDFSISVDHILTLILEDGGTTNVDLSPYTNTLSEAEVDAYVSNNGYLTNEVDGDVTNEIQDLSLDGNTLSLSLSVPTVDLSGYLDNTDDQAIQDFSITDNVLTLTLEDGGTTNVDLSAYTNDMFEANTDDQTQSWNQATLELTIEDGNTVVLSGLLTNYDETDPVFGSYSNSAAFTNDVRAAQTNGTGGSLPSGTPPCVLIMNAADTPVWLTIDAAYKGVFRNASSNLVSDYIRAH